MKNKFRLLLLLAISGNLIGQPLDFAQALEMTLRNNYDIGISRIDVEAAENNNTAGNAGFLPTLDAQGQYDYGNSNTNITFFDGSTINRNNAESQNLTADATLNWTVFDGFRMFARRSELEATEALAENALRAQIEVASLDLAQIYYSIIFEQQLLPVFQQNLEISKSRQKIVESAKSLGAASGLEVNQALVDVTNDSITLLEQQNRLKNLRQDLLLILGDTAQANYEIGEEITIDSTLEFASLNDSLYELNTQLMISRNEMEISQSLIAQARSEYYPEISLFGSYAYNFSQNEAGQAQQLRRTGPVVGIRVQFNLFNGFNDRRLIKNSRLQYESAQLNVNRTKQQASNGLKKAYNNYSYYLRILKLREQNIQRAREVVDFALKQLELGLINSIDFRTVQLTYLQAEIDFFNARYNAKLAEIQLEILSGNFSLELI